VTLWLDWLTQWCGAFYFKLWGDCVVHMPWHRATVASMTRHFPKTSVWYCHTSWSVPGLHPLLQPAPPVSQSLRGPCLALSATPYRRAAVAMLRFICNHLRAGLCAMLPASSLKGRSATIGYEGLFAWQHNSISLKVGDVSCLYAPHHEMQNSTGNSL
jgi:hypothetical protein